LKSEVVTKLRSGRDVLLNIDVQGASAIQAKAEEDEELRRALVCIFLTPVSMSELERRLKKRGTDAPPVIQKRLGVARQELAQWKHFDYLLISTSIEEDVRRARAILAAERMKQARATPPSFD
jgi:guanylate kinase